MKRKILATILTALMIISMVPVTAFAAEFSDMPNDWSRPALENAVENGLLTGANGKLMPSAYLSRAQMAAIINRAFGATKKSSLNAYSDMPATAWYYDDMAKAVQMKTFVGSNGKLNPNGNISREEVFVVIARAFKLSGGSQSVLNKFSDKSNISSWAVDSVASLVEAGYIAGSGGKISPKQYISRAEFAQIMYNLLKNYFKQAGTYIKVDKGNVMISVSDVTLKNVTIDGDLIIGDGVGDGDVILDSVKVTGRTVIRGGGVNSIKIVGNSEVGRVIITKVDGQVRVVTEDGSTVDVVYVDDGKDDVIIEGTIGSVEVAADVPVVLQNADVGSVTVSASNSNVTIDNNSNVGTVSLSNTAQGSTLSVAGTVATVNTDAPNTGITVSGTVANVTVGAGANGSSIGGGGTVNNANIQGDNTSVNTVGTSVTVGGNVTGTTSGGQEVTGGTSGTTTSGGGVTPPTPPIVGGGGGGGGPSPLETAKTEAKAALAAALAEYTQSDYTPENWIVLTGAKTAGDLAIDVATDLAGVASAKDAALAAMADVETIAETDERLASAVETMITQLPVVPELAVPKVPDIKPNPDAAELDAVYVYLEYLENTGEVEAAKDAFDSLRETARQLVDTALQNKLSAAVVKVEELTDFVINNTIVGIGTYREDYSGLTAGAKGRIMVTPSWPFYLADGFNSISGMTNLEIYLINGDNELVRNTANLEILNPTKTGNWPTRTSGSFDLGVARPSSSGSWNNGLYQLIGDKVTQADLPDKVVVEFTYKGVSFVIETSVNYTPDMFAEIKAAILNDTGTVGINTIEGTTYILQGYELLDSETNDQIVLTASNIERMTVLNPGVTEAVELTVGDDSDPLMWFNIRKVSGNYLYTIVTKAGDVYQATLTWTAPAVLEAVKQGDETVLCGDGKYRYHYIVNLDITPEDSLVYRIKPDGIIDQQTILSDSDGVFNIYFRPTDGSFTQQEGDHIYVFRKGSIWYQAVINYTEPPVFNATQSIGYNSIQAAINSATNGDTIQVAAGVYNLSEPIKVTQAVTLTGDTLNPDEVILNAPTAGDDREVFQILSNNVTIQGFTIQGSKDVQKGTSWNSNAGIAVGGDKLMFANKPIGATEFTFNYWGYAVEDISILNNIITDNSYGIFLFHSRNVVIEGNTICNSTRDANTWSGKGIAIYTSKDMADSDLVSVGTALPHTNNITINNNYIFENELYGIELNHSEAYHGGDVGPFEVDISITNNTIYNNGGPLDALGAALDYSRGISANGNETNVTVTGNEIYGHVATSGTRFSSSCAGIRINNSSGWTIEDNDIHDNTRGIYAYGTSSDIIITANNEFSDNAQAIVMKNINTGTIEEGVTFTDNNVTTWEADGIATGDIVYLEEK